jgi:hypothetical protein
MGRQNSENSRQKSPRTVGKAKPARRLHSSTQDKTQPPDTTPTPQNSQARLAREQSPLSRASRDENRENERERAHLQLEGPRRENGPGYRMGMGRGIQENEHLQAQASKEQAGETATTRQTRI